MRNDARLLEAKKALYHALLETDYKEYTDTEVELSFQLAQDHQIQELFRKVDRITEESTGHQTGTKGKGVTG